ncbi:MAG: transcriptional regulator [Desulfotalea sp.]|nr:MAG: transcriptional regulator [Desulfotalea sp.]
MKEFIRVMKAMSDPNRVRIVKLLQLKELCVCELQELLGLAQSTVSKHLKVLDEAGLLSNSRDGAWVIYAVTKSEDSAHINVLLQELRGWVDDDPVYVAMKRRLPFVDRVRISASCG